MIKPMPIAAVINPSLFFSVIIPIKLAWVKSHYQSAALSFELGGVFKTL